MLGMRGGGGGGGGVEYTVIRILATGSVNLCMGTENKADLKTM